MWQQIRRTAARRKDRHRRVRRCAGQLTQLAATLPPAEKDEEEGERRGGLTTAIT
jgi:hypothetical protein